MTDPNPLLDAALALEAAGLSVVPTRADGSKAPAAFWRQYMLRRAKVAELRSWFSDGTYDGLGVVCGAVSGSLEMLELEGRAGPEALTQLRDLAEASGLGDLWQRVTTGYLEFSPSGGVHLLYRVDGDVAGNTKLAKDERNDTLAETRGEGGYVIVAPSGGRTHESGRPWVLAVGGPASIPTIGADERDALHDLVRTLDRSPKPEPVAPAQQPRERVDDGRLTPGDDFNQRTSWADLLVPRGWALVYRGGDGTCYWRRPDKAKGISATSGRDEHDRLYVFSSNAHPFEQEKPYQKWSAYALLEHGGDYSAAARALREQGYGDPVERKSELPELIAPVAPATGLPAEGDHPKDGDAADEPRERTSWWPRDLGPVLDGRDSEPPPTLLVRNDGAALIYPGKVNALLGESESGKTWVALLAVLQCLRDGLDVVYLDFEDTAAGIVTRLRSMGATDAELARLHYIGPDENLHAGAAADLTEALDGLEPTLAVVDGVNAAMTLLGLDLQDNKDATRFAQLVLRPVARRGVAVLTVDHVPKNKEARGKGGIGAQAKRAMVTGSAFLVDVLAEFGRGQTGRLRLTVDKDRPGHVRGASQGGKRAGVAVLTSSDDGTAVQLSIEAPDLRPVEVKEDAAKTRRKIDITAFLGRQQDMTANQGRVLAGVKGGREDKLEALVELEQSGHIKGSEGARNANLYTLVKPYSELDAMVVQAADSPTSAPRRDLGATSAAPGCETQSDDLGTSACAYKHAEVRSSASVGSAEINCGKCGAEVDRATAEINKGMCTRCWYAARGTL